MKRSLIVVMIVALLLGFVMVSCDSNAATDKLGEVSIASQNSRGIDSATESAVKPVEELYWYFVAKKTDGGLFATGKTTWKALNMNGTEVAQGFAGSNLGKFSYGEWEFSFYGFEESGKTVADKDAAVYFCKEMPVTVGGRIELEVALTPGTVSAGSVEFKNLEFVLPGADEIGENLTGNFKLFIKEGETVIATSDEIAYAATMTTVPFTFENKAFFIPDSVAAGSHRYTFEVIFDNAVVATEDRDVVIAAGLKTTISGSVTAVNPTDEVVIATVTGETTATAGLQVSENTPAIVSAAVSPVAASNPDAPAATTVAFDAGVLPEGNYDLAIEVKDAGSAVTFTVEGGAQQTVTAVAAIDLSLKQGSTDVALDAQDNGLVTVTTYIATGLTNVDVFYEGNNTFQYKGETIHYMKSYNATSGELTIQTNHFSEYYVTSNDVAMIGDKGYESLLNAILAVKNDETIVMFKDAPISLRINTGKTFAIDMGGNELTGIIWIDGANVTLKNGKFIQTGNSYIYGSLDETAENYSVFTVAESATVTGGYTFIVCGPEYGSVASYGCVLNIYGTLDADVAGVFLSGNMKSGNTVVNVYEGATIESDDVGIALNGFATTNVFGGTITAPNALPIKAGNLYISGGTVYSTGAYLNPAEADGSGTEDTGAGVGITSNYNTNSPIVVNITGGTIKSKYGNAVLLGYSQQKDGSFAKYSLGVTLSVTGGEFIAETAGRDAIFVDTARITELANGDAVIYTNTL